MTYIDNKVRSAFGFIQNDTWGGTLTGCRHARRPLRPGRPARPFDGMGRCRRPGHHPELLRRRYRAADRPARRRARHLQQPLVGTAAPGTCLAEFTHRPADLGKDARALYPVEPHVRPVRHVRRNLRARPSLREDQGRIPRRWCRSRSARAGSRDNEFAILLSATTATSRRSKGEYHNWLPAIDFDIEPIERREAARIVQPHDHPRRLCQPAGRPDARTRRSASAAEHGRQGNPGCCRTSRRTSICRPNGITARQSYVSVGYSTRTCQQLHRHDDDVRRRPSDLTNPAAGRGIAGGCRRRWAPARRFDRSVDYIATNYPGARVPQRGARGRHPGRCRTIRLVFHDQPAGQQRPDGQAPGLGVRGPAQLLGHRLRRDPELHDRQQRHRITTTRCATP